MTPGYTITARGPSAPLSHCLAAAPWQLNRSHPPQLNVIKALLSVGFLHAKSATLLTAANAKEEGK